MLLQPFSFSVSRKPAPRARFASSSHMIHDLEMQERKKLEFGKDARVTNRGMWNAKGRFLRKMLKEGNLLLKVLSKLRVSLKNRKVNEKRVISTSYYLIYK